MAALDRLSRIINIWVERLLFVIGFSMAAIVALQVFFRYVLNHSLFWSEESARYLLVWLTFLGATAAYRRELHPGIDTVYALLPPSMKKVAAVATRLFALMLFAVMIFYGITFSYFIRLQVTPALALPKWIVFSVIPFSGLIFMIHGITFFLQDIADRHHDG